MSKDLWNSPQPERHGEIIMIEVTTKANQAIADYCRTKKSCRSRIFLKMGGCGIRSFGLALEAAQNHQTNFFTLTAITFIIER